MSACLIEKCVIEHCSPTLAGIKPAGLFSCPLGGEAEVLEQIRQLNLKLSGRGVVVSVMNKRDGRALIYVYREAMLKKALENRETAEFLKTCGYGGLNVEKAVARLKERLAQSDGFPHEIGLFLGYPPEDVQGFIQNRGQNCKCCGCWKVYGDPESATRQFARFKKCREVYLRMFNGGRSLHQLTVAS